MQQHPNEGKKSIIKLTSVHVRVCVGVCVCKNTVKLRNRLQNLYCQCGGGTEGERLRNEDGGPD